MKSKKVNIVKNLFLIIISFILSYPIFIVIINSLKSNNEIFSNTFGFPENVLLENYAKAITDGGLGIAFLNSTIVTGISVILIVILSTFVAYALSRPNMKGRNFFYILFIMGMSIPTHVGLLQLYKTLSNYNLTNSRLGLIVAYIGMGLPFSVFVMTRFFLAIPKEIQESARVDGCNNFRMYFNIILPLSPTIIVTVMIVNTVLIWNDMLYPMIFISSKNLKPLPTALLAFQGEFLSQYNMMFAGAILASLPLVIIFLTLQKQFIQGMTDGAVKG